MPAHYALARADKDLFARCQTIYSGADTNMQINWESRLRDTTWTDDCFWILKDGERIGGALVLGDTIRFPFLIPPHESRYELWEALRQINAREKLGITKAYGALDEDVPILLSHGYAVELSRRYMVRPTDTLLASLHDGFVCRVPNPKEDIPEMIKALEVGYENGIGHHVFGPPEPGEVEKDTRSFLDGYEKTDTLHHSSLVIHRESNRIAGLCLAGNQQESTSPLFSFIADLVVLPEFRRHGLAEFMLRRAVSEAAGEYPLSGLCVIVGNPAERLYRKLGFWGGPRFTNMVRKYG